MNQELKTSTRNEFLNHIKAQETSGVSVAEYCKLHKVDLNKFYYYKSYRPVASKPKSKAANIFTKVKIKVDDNTQILPSTKVVQPRLDSNIDPIWLARFISTLNSCI